MDFFIVDAHPSWSLYFAKPADGVYGWAGADYGVWGKGVIEAIDYQTGQNSLELTNLDRKDRVQEC